MKIKSLLVCGSMAVLGAAFTSCSKDIAFDNDAYAAQKKGEYEANFVKKYGQVDPNKSWDLSSMQPSHSLTPHEFSTRAVTRGDDSFTKTVTKGFVIEQKVLAWMFKNIPAGKNNSGMGNPFYMTVPLNSFTVVPIFQGNARYYWQLWMHVDGVEKDIKVWEKGDNLGYRTVAGGTLTPTGTEQAGVSRSAVEVEAPAITFSGLPQNAAMYFYLKKWDSFSDYNNDALKTQFTKLSSMDQKMLALKNCIKPAAVPEGNIVNIIGCEDAGDNDYEDLVFMVYGIPTITEVEEMYETYTKRYMVEDLGTTDDFDFNDIVVDVSQETKTVYTYEVDENQRKHLKDTDGPTLMRQWAEVRAAGGTLDFTLKIGSTLWTKSEHLAPASQMRNTSGSINYNAVLDRFIIEGKDWNPAANNITITVEGRGINEGVQEIQFPKRGEIPMIIAVDKEIRWMYERQGVPGGTGTEGDWWY